MNSCGKIYILEAVAYAAKNKDAVMVPLRRKMMACFTIPLAEAVVVTAVKALAFRRNTDAVISRSKEALGTLEKMLYGGSFLLAIEHIYHGEVVFYPPFLTAMKNPADIPEMLHEMATVGVGMAVLVTAVWGIACGIKAVLNKRLPRGGSGMVRGAL